MTDLENIQKWNVEIVKATDIYKLLRIISKKELSKYRDFDFCKRAQCLAERLEKIIDSQGTSK